MLRLTKLILLASCLLSVAAYADSITLATSAGALGANDSIDWSYLGADGASIPNQFSGTTANNKQVTIFISGADGQVADVGGSWGPASGAFSNGDSLIWAFDNNTSSGAGPLSFLFPTGSGAGAAIQADSPGQFTAKLELFNGSVSLGFVTETSDQAGDAIYIGAFDVTGPNVTRAVFSLTSAQANSNTSNNLGDFALGALSLHESTVPEPASLVLLATALCLMFFRGTGGRFLPPVKRPLLLLLLSLQALAQQSPTGYATVIPVTGPPQNGAYNSLNSSIPPLPQWTYTTTASSALGGGTYSGSMIGRSPFDRGKTTTTIPTQIIPLVITINDGTRSGTVTYDPTAADSCVPGHTDVDIIAGSPIFTNNVWTMNGVNMGDTQYIDAFQRAEFWSLVAGTPYHLVLNESTLASQSLTFGSGVAGSSGPGQNYNAASFGGCGSIGVVQINDLNAAVQALITGPLAALVNVGTFPIFLTKNVVSANSGTNIFVNCCALGYHSGFTAGPNLQIYSPFSLDTTGVFGRDVSTLSHEMAEAINDPTGNNPTPSWGHIGQQNGCQANLEVGDPLSPGSSTPTNEFILQGTNGFTYHLQELAFYNWFFGGPSLGAAGKYSNNGTFSGAAKLCPPGGTN